MRVVLGIDAAWTASQPSGVALVIEDPTGWHLVALANSYQEFIDLSKGIATKLPRATGSLPNTKSLLGSAVAICSHSVDLVAIDMPLSYLPIIGRRTSDNAVSQAYGARKCGTHTPSALRPGHISDDLRKSFAHAGYPLCTNALRLPGLIEVYPHPALVELLQAKERIPYKVSKVRNYWPSATPHERRKRLINQWKKIVSHLEMRISGISDALPPLELDASTRHLKAYEDMLDAVICACVGIYALNGHAISYGDKDSAIWVPQMIRSPAA